MAQRSAEELLADWSSGLEAVLYDREVEEAIREVRQLRTEKSMSWHYLGHTSKLSLGLPELRPTGQQGLQPYWLHQPALPDRAGKLLCIQICIVGSFKYINSTSDETQECGHHKCHSHRFYQGHRVANSLRAWSHGIRLLLDSDRWWPRLQPLNVVTTFSKTHCEK